MLTESRKWARKNFDDHKHAESGSVMAEQAVEHAAATAMILRKNVVQGESSEGAPQHYSEFLSCSCFWIESNHHEGPSD